MVTKQLVKDEIDNIPEEHLPVLYKIVLALEEATGSELQAQAAGGPECNAVSAWHEFVAETYGCLADDPIERGDQGWYEDRGSLT